MEQVIGRDSFIKMGIRRKLLKFMKIDFQAVYAHLYKFGFAQCCFFVFTQIALKNIYW